MDTANKPVAWMYRIKDTDNRWELIFNKPLNDDKFFDTVPLYTHPHPDNLGLAESIVKQQQLEIEALKEALQIMGIDADSIRRKAKE